MYHDELWRYFIWQFSSAKISHETKGGLRKEPRELRAITVEISSHWRLLEAIKPTSKVELQISSLIRGRFGPSGLLGSTFISHGHTKADTKIETVRDVVINGINIGEL